MTKRSGITAIAPLAFLLIILACDKSFDTIGIDTVDGQQINTGTYYAPVYARTRSFYPVRSDGLTLQQLGWYDDPVFGRSTAELVSQYSLSTQNPTFGDLTQELEDRFPDENVPRYIQEEETVLRAYLYLPFQSTSSIDTESGERSYELDSIFGNLEAIFNLKIHENTFYLRELDPSTDFEEAQEYFSDENFIANGFNGILLGSQNNYKISNEEIYVQDQLGENVDTLAPGIKIDLDKDFFQTHILDKEGQVELLNNDVFREYLRGIIIELEETEEEGVMMLLDFDSAYINLDYSYLSYNEEAVDLRETLEKSFRLNLGSPSIKVNNLVQENYPTSISTSIDQGYEADKLYVKGGEGLFLELRLFDLIEDGPVLEGLRDKSWIINDASLSFYIDAETLYQNGDYEEPLRIYLYELGDEQGPTIDYNPGSDTPDADGNPLSVHGGIIERSEDGRGYRYKIRITDHISNLLREGADNIVLGVVATMQVTNEYLITVSQKYPVDTEDKEDVPQPTIYHPFGSIFFGGNYEDETKKLQLEIHYTDTDVLNN